MAQSSPERTGEILGLLVIAEFVVVIDFSIVQIALPTIRDQLGMSLADSQWVVSAYGATFAGFLLLSGKLCDVYGSKRLFLIGLLVFSFSSVSCGLATTGLVLIASRVVQGIGAAIASATGLAMITRIFALLGRLNQALGIFTAVSSAGFAAGVLMGGILTEALGWRWIFFVNVPIGLLAIVLSSRILPNLTPVQGTSRRLDYPGAVAITGGLVLFVYGLSEVGNGDASLVAYLSLALAVVASVGFILIERRSASPIVPLGLPRRRTVFFANATALFTFATTVPWIFFMTSFFQAVLKYSPLEAAEAFIPASLTFFFLSGFGTPRLVKRLGARPVLVVAMVLLAAGTLLASLVTPASSYLTFILVTMLLTSGGGALSATASNIAALSGTRRGEEGVASGLINTSRQVGGPVGLALAVSVADIATHGAGLGGSLAEVILGLQDAFVAAAACATLAIVTSLLIPGNRREATPASSVKPISGNQLDTN